MLDRGLRSGHGAGSCLMTGLFRKNSKANEGPFVQLPNRGFLFLCKTLGIKEWISYRSRALYKPFGSKRERCDSSVFIEC